MASRAWAWLHTGLNFGPLDAGVWDKFEGYWTVLPLLPTLVNATFIRLFGLKVGSLRLASLLAGFGLLAIVYYIFYELYRSRRGGLIAVFLVSTSLSFLYSSHFIRQDIYVATLGFGAIALYLAGRRRQQSVLSLLAGLLIGAAFEFHPNGAIYAPVIGALYLLDDGRRFCSSAELLGLRVWNLSRSGLVCLAPHYTIPSDVCRYDEPQIPSSHTCRLLPHATPSRSCSVFRAWQDTSSWALAGAYWQQRSLLPSFYGTSGPLFT